MTPILQMTHPGLGFTTQKYFAQGYTTREWPTSKETSGHVTFPWVTDCGYLSNYTNYLVRESVLSEASKS